MIVNEGEDAHGVALVVGDGLVDQGRGACSPLTASERLGYLCRSR